MGLGLVVNASSQLFTMSLSPVPVYTTEVRGAEVSTLFRKTRAMGLMALQSAPLKRRLFEGSSLRLPEIHDITCCLIFPTSSLRSKRRILTSHERHCS